MIAYRSQVQAILSKVGTIAVTLLGLLTLTFIIGRVMPNDPVRAIVGEEATREVYENVYRQLGLDRPMWEQFYMYLHDVVTLDLGKSVRTGMPVLEDILHVMPATIELALFAIIISATLGVTLGMVAAVNKDRWPDHLIRVFSLMGHSMPIFWTGMIALIIFYAKLGWVGGSGRMSQFYIGLEPNTTGFLLLDSAMAGEWDVFKSALQHIILPASLLGYSSAAFITRMTRSFMLDQINQEYITTARVKGLSQCKTIWFHAFINIRVQLITIVALAFGTLLEGSILIETVFAWPGFGSYLVGNLMIGDMNSLMTCVLIVGLIFTALNLISDILYRVFDPRTR
ncbi:peptide/nickel transport system permease protein [Cohaesibacter marisflavi]|uniref:Peptide/nickel transport system permease protein n=1 Tax=Cohaesibacter marisflavi TaxID=655353 RepID=A0A1I5I3D8_9HYPH|nr:ABC transporter permease [Cohaesibacter marisflavi]SFO55114.1 peptide/nickel transport system permease protein [Cohaesibacter marisflavi]